MAKPFRLQSTVSIPFYSWCGKTSLTYKKLALSEPIDVYCEWVDACEAVAKSEKPSYSAEKSSLADNSRLDETEEYGDGPSKTGASDSEDGY